MSQDLRRLTQLKPKKQSDKHKNLAKWFIGDQLGRTGRKEKAQLE